MPVSASTQVTRIPENWPKFARQVLALFDKKCDIGGDTFTGNLALQSTGTPALFIESFVDNITAHAGGGQGSATALTAEINRVTTVATLNDSVALPAATQGLSIYVINHGANDMQVFGSGTDQIDDIATATGVSQMAGSLCLYTCATAGRWYSNGLGTGYSGSFETMSAIDNLTAHAGGGQGSALALTKMVNRVTTVASANDSVVLPASARGMNVVVINAAAANSMNVFPASGEQINALGANAAFAQAAGKTATFYCATAGQWHALLSA